MYVFGWFCVQKLVKFMVSEQAKGVASQAGVAPTRVQHLHAWWRGNVECASLFYGIDTLNSTVASDYCYHWPASVQLTVQVHVVVSSHCGLLSLLQILQGQFPAAVAACAPLLSVKACPTTAACSDQQLYQC